MPTPVFVVIVVVLLGLFVADVKVIVEIVREERKHRRVKPKERL